MFNLLLSLNEGMGKIMKYENVICNRHGHTDFLLQFTINIIANYKDYKQKKQALAIFYRGVSSCGAYASDESNQGDICPFL